MAESEIEAFAALEQRVEERTKELKLAHEQLRHAGKLSAVGQLSASIAHEFNNPLYGVVNVIKGIKRRVSLEEADAELVEMSLKECDRMKNLIRDLQNFNRPTTGIAEELNLDKAIDSILLLCKKDFKTRKIVVGKDFATGLPPNLLLGS